MWRRLLTRMARTIRRQRNPGTSAGQTWEADDRQAAQGRLRDLAQQRRAAHLYDGPTQ